MKLVIDIDDEDYKRIQDTPDIFSSLTSRTYSAIRNGTPLTERPKGKWIMFDDEANAYCCNQCNEVFYLEYGNPKNNGYRYCPNCGAEMSGGEEDEV